MLVMGERACWLWGREHAGDDGESMLVMGKEKRETSVGLPIL